MNAETQFPGMPAYPIKKRIGVAGVNVVLLNVPPNENCPRNVFGLTDQGDVLWQVEPRPAEEPNNTYTSMREELGVVVARTSDNVQRKIDPKTGKVLQEERIAEGS